MLLLSVHAFSAFAGTCIAEDLRRLNDCLRLQTPILMLPMLHSHSKPSLHDIQEPLQDIYEYLGVTM